MTTLVPRIVKSATDARIERGEAKKFCGITHDDDDNDIDGMIDTAVGWLQPPRGVLAFSIAKQTLRIDLPCWPLQMIHLPCGPVVEINSIKYSDDLNVEQTLDPTNYFLDNDTLMWSISFAAPSIYLRPSAVRIEYDAGMGDDEFAASTLKMAMLRIVKRLYDNRDDFIEGTVFDPAAFGVDTLIMPYRFR